MSIDDPVLDRITEEFRRLMRAFRPGEGMDWLSIHLTMPQLKTLFLLCSEGKQSGRDLARALGVGPSAVTPLVDRLVEHGYARREEDSSDRRITWIYPTERGLSLIENLQTARKEQLGRIVSRLTPAERELVAEAISLLRNAAERAQAGPNAREINTE